MAKTIETYMRTVDPPAMSGDEAFLTSDGNRSEGSIFIPQLPLSEIVGIQAGLEATFGDSSDQIFAVDPRITRVEAGEPIVVATGICAFPMEYNAQLNPTGGPGTAAWFNAETGEALVLPKDISAAVQILVDNPPPITVANLMKAGGLSVAPPIVVEEVRFYTDWIAEKLAANSGQTMSDETMQPLREQLAGYVREQFIRNRAAFERLRQLTLGKEDLAPALIVEDTMPAYRENIDEQVERWRRNLPDGAQLDIAGLRAAAYYSSALERAYRAAGVLPADSRLVIAEGAGNVVVPRNGTAFNDARRVAFADLVRSSDMPLLAVYPSPSTSSSLRKAPLEAGPVNAVPSSRQPDLDTYIGKKTPVLNWSLGLPGSKGVRMAQRDVMRTPGDPDAEQRLLNELARVVRKVLVGNES